MTKSKVTALPLAETRQKIESLESEINNLQQELTQSQDALNLILNPPRFAPVQGQLPFFDRLSGILQESKSEQERLEKVEAARKAIAQTKQLLAQKQQELAAVKDELERLKEEAVWQERYEPLVSAFQHGYTMPSAQRAKIAQVEGYLHSAVKFFEEMQEIKNSDAPEIKKNWELKHPGLGSLKTALATQQEEVTKQQEELAQAKKVNQEHFRNFIKKRVDVEAPLQALLISQEAYFKAREQFLETVGDGAALGIDVNELKQSKIPLVACVQSRIQISKIPSPE
ncbi:MAG: hypothetical protein KME46_33500 [Brasilonema angustatum HA4187-MV1]|jgi:DNA repair exonuclease SbcCD ATPase subunit|nr:hypothetical protein [Brasilonema angustatum HA4187-MV1]